MQSMFTEIDADGSGEVSYEELTAYITQLLDNKVVKGQ